jgi:hypothetical protein
MNQRNSLPSANKLTVAALLVAAAGFVIQIVSGIDVPTVPPGLLILLVAAGLIALLPWRWMPVVGAAVGLPLHCTRRSRNASSTRFGEWSGTFTRRSLSQKARAFDGSASQQ